jgi:hypothetical protein
MKNFLRFAFCLVLITGVSCKKKSEDPPAPVPYTTFKLGGIQKTYNYASSFTKDFCSSSTFCCRFYLTKDTTSAETLKIGIPGDPIVGHTYTTGEYRFSCFYCDSRNVRYDFASAPFQVIFTVWDGQGGWGKGTFSGWLKSEYGDSIHFQDGYFQNKIWTLGTN